MEEFHKKGPRCIQTYASTYIKKVICDCIMTFLAYSELICHTAGSDTAFFFLIVRYLLTYLLVR